MSHVFHILSSRIDSVVLAIVDVTSSNFSLVVARLASVNFTLVSRTIYRFLSWSIRADLMFFKFHICYSTRYIDESLDITRDTRSSFLEAISTIIYRHSTLSSRLLIVSRSNLDDHSSSLETFFTIAHRHSTHSSRSFDIIYERSTSTEVVKNKLIEARTDFRREILSRF